MIISENQIMVTLLLLGVYGCFLCVVDGGAARPNRVTQYEYFDDYLLEALTAPRDQQFNQVLKPTRTTTVSPRLTGTTEAGVNRSTPTTPRTPPRQQTVVTDEDILGYFRDVPREHWSCCMLGKLAGDKGFHCHAGFYAARITARNPNRAHNRKLHFYGRERIPNWGRNIMHTFQRCVLRHSQEFHNCCYTATVERRERHRWARWRNRDQRRRRRANRRNTDTRN